MADTDSPLTRYLQAQAGQQPIVDPAKTTDAPTKGFSPEQLQQYSAQLYQNQAANQPFISNPLYTGRPGTPTTEAEKAPTPGQIYPPSTILTPGSPSQQQTLTDLLKPAIAQLGNINQGATNGVVGTPSPSVAHALASSLQGSIENYQQGLDAMLKVVPGAAGSQALQAGLKNVISYPYYIQGQSSTPPGLGGSQSLESLFQFLNGLRNPGTSTLTNPSGSSSGGGYNGSIQSLLPANSGL